MRIVHLNTYDISGGDARAVLRLHESLLKLKADVVHLHWINNGMLSIEDLKEINAPIVWTFHDSWPYTGGCHIVGDCKRFRKSCGSCPVLNSNKEIDLSSRVLSRKEIFFKKIDPLLIISLSEWMALNIQSSKLFKGRKLKILPNTINTNVFKTHDMKLSRELFGLPEQKKLILFGAFSATTDINKGYSELLKALGIIKDKSNIECVIFGNDDNDIKSIEGFKVHMIGKIMDDNLLSNLYSACDVMVVPSRQESFGQTALESLSCGTPVCSFNHSGLKDIVRHKDNGFLAKPLDAKSLAEGICWIIENSEKYDLRQKARTYVKKKYSYNIVGREYYKTYSEFLKNQVNPM